MPEVPTETTDPSLQPVEQPAEPKGFAAAVTEAVNKPAPLPVAALIPLSGLAEMPAITEATALALHHFKDGGGLLTEAEGERITLAAALIRNYAMEMTPEGQPDPK